MEDSDFLCPLCCEELDISDRNFYPCKCGYQVCMWCWHRIRESESGLCPACRTPYGDDPHEFSAVDVDEVLKANKEKAAAEKSKPKDGTAEDRTALANMRVIRRNLVYAVGLPPLSEEQLRKPEYFGQYGKINKMVLNRNNPPAGDARRTSASAYVTFFHKEDTLACILALDGFYMDNRNIRASYGTSKYCSAFIKNVRCNNPECTYLHSMGEKEDTFTKQEIQAGYVTSGRDVLERLQTPGARRKVGGGGPSGTGKASANPIFPPPIFEEPPKPPALLPPVRASVKRSSSLGTSPPSSGNLPRSKSLATAASVVAGMHAPEPSSVPPQRTTTLTPLTPLKPRSTSLVAKSKLLQEPVMRKQSTSTGVPASKSSEDLIGGFVIGGTPMAAPSIFSMPSIGGSSLLGGDVIGGGTIGGGGSRLTGLGGEIYTGELNHTTSSVIGGDKWNVGVHGGGISMLGISDFNGSTGAKSGYGAIGSGAIGGSAIRYSDTNNGSSNLVNMLGGNMSGGSAALVNDNNPFLHQSGGGPIGRSGMSHTISGGVIGGVGAIGPGAIGNPSRSGVIGAPGTNPSGVIGGMAIGGGPGTGAAGGGSQSDIALLQSLLPGVHITSGHGQASSADTFGSIGSNWNSGGQPNGRTWSGNSGGGFQAAPGGGVIGGPKQNSQQAANRSHIW